MRKYFWGSISEVLGYLLNEIAGFCAFIMFKIKAESFLWKRERTEKVKRLHLALDDEDSKFKNSMWTRNGYQFLKQKQRKPLWLPFLDLL